MISVSWISLLTGHGWRPIQPSGASRRLFQNADNLGHADTPDAVAFEELFNLRGAQPQGIGRCWGRFPQLQKPFLREIAVNLKHLRIKR